MKNNPHKYSFLFNNEGFSMLLTIMSVALFSVLGISIISITSNTLNTTKISNEDYATYYVAEAALTELKVQIIEEINNAALNAIEIEDPEKREDYFQTAVTTIGRNVETNDWIDFYSDIPFSETKYNEDPIAKYKITVNPKSDGSLEYTIQSRANINNHERELEQFIEIQPAKIHFYNGNSQGHIGDGDTNEETPVYSGDKLKSCFAVYANGSIETPNGSGTINGDIYAKGPITINGNSTIYGSAFTNSSFSMSKGNLKGSVWAVGQAELTGGIIEGDVYPNQNNSSKIDNNCTTGLITLPADHTIFKTKPNPIYTPKDELVGQNGNKNNYVIKNGTLMIYPETDNYILELDRDIYFDAITFESNKTLRIDLNGQTRNIFVNDLNLDNGNIQLINPTSGKLNIYVLDKIFLNNGSLNSNGKVSDVNIFYSGQETKLIEIGKSSDINGNLFIKDANLLLSGNGSVKGDLYVYGENEIEITGSGSASDQLFLAPNSKITISGNGEINGNVVTRDFIYKGSALINPPDTDIPLIPGSYPSESDNSDYDDTKDGDDDETGGSSNNLFFISSPRDISN